MKSETHYIKASRLIDGVGEPVQKNVLLTLKSDTILNISHFNSDDFPDPSLITDLSHCTILTPLVDSHIHLALSSSVNPTVSLWFQWLTYLPSVLSCFRRCLGRIRVVFLKWLILPLVFSYSEFDFYSIFDL